MATRFAAALSFYTLFSLVPLLFLTVAIVGFVSTDSVLTGVDCEVAAAATIPADPSNPLDRVISQVQDIAGTQVADQLAGLTCEATAIRSQALGIGILLTAFSASSIFLHVQAVLNYIFHVPQDRRKGIMNLIVQRAIALGSALVLAVLVLIPIVAVAGVNLIRGLIEVSWLRNLLGVAVPLTSLIMLVVVVGITFQLLTRARIPWQAARRGGYFTAVAGLLGAFLVGTYLGNFGASGTLGAVGGVAILLFFFNLMWMIYLFGAELTKVYGDFLEHGDVMAPSQRETTSQRARALSARDESVHDESGRAESPARSGIMAFVVGLVTGWVARRRGD